jgi:REP element-mobilizing transposase RayT
MVRAYHIIISCYGFWLPNDPRGSWSTWVHSWELFRYGGPATKVNTRRSVANIPHDRAKRQAMKQHLKYPPVIFTGEQARSVALGFGDAARDGGYTILACAVLPDHAHLVVARDARLSEQIRSHLKRAASRRLRKESLHPLAAYARHEETPPSPWSRGGWQVYLNTDEDIVRAVRYVEDNPVREGKKRQRWSFVTPLEAFPAGL